jgi:hypothetical protein
VLEAARPFPFDRPGGAVSIVIVSIEFSTGVFRMPLVKGELASCEGPGVVRKGRSDVAIGIGVALGAFGAILY